MGAAEVICCFFLEEKIYTTDQKLVNTSTHAYLRCVCAGKQASAYTQPSRYRGKGTYIVLTGCVEWREGASSHDHHGGRRHRRQKHVFYFEKNISPEMSEHVHTRVPEI